MRVNARVVAVLALLTVVPTAAAAQQSAPLKWLTTVSDNATLVRAGSTVLSVLLPINTTVGVYYLKLFNKATQPMCAVDVPKWTIPIPYGASNAGGGVALPTGGLQFPAGLGFCVVGGIADGDDTPAAAGIAINMGVSGK